MKGSQFSCDRPKGSMPVQHGFKETQRRLCDFLKHFRRVKRKIETKAEGVRQGKRLSLSPSFVLRLNFELYMSTMKYQLAKKSALFLQQNWHETEFNFAVTEANIEYTTLILNVLYPLIYTATVQPAIP